MKHPHHLQHAVSALHSYCIYLYHSTLRRNVKSLVFKYELVDGKIVCIKAI